MAHLVNLLFEGGSSEKIAIIGSGGKTSLLWLLAAACRHEPALVSTTTKIFPPEASLYDYFIRSEDDIPEILAEGVSLLAQEEKEKMPPKLGGVSDEELAHVAGCFAHVFVECDGSRQLPYKGWAEYEPVIPDWITTTIGIVPILHGGETVGSGHVHRPELFCQITGAHSGEALTMAHLVAMITHPLGLFAKSRGKKILFINQCDVRPSFSFSDGPVPSEYLYLSQSSSYVNSYGLAEELVSLLPDSFKEGLYLILAGSVLSNEGFVLWRQT